jgi:hypothetical protein
MASMPQGKAEKRSRMLKKIVQKATVLAKNKKCVRCATKTLHFPKNAQENKYPPNVYT